MISDDGQILMRVGTSVIGSSADPIRVYSRTFASVRTLAGDFGAADFGRAPGISDDGDAIGFYANLASQSKADSMSTNVGPGVFIEVRDSDGSLRMIRVAGRTVNQNDLDGTCTADCKFAELGFDPNDLAVGFADSSGNHGFEKDSRVAVVHQRLGDPGLDGDTFIVSFVARPNGPSPNAAFTIENGLWTVQVDFFTDSSGLKYKIRRPVPVVQINDQIGEGRFVRSLSVYDQLANAKNDSAGNPRTEKQGDHRAAFFVSTSSSPGGPLEGQAVVRASQIDSDDDALFDHWELHGIDFDQDGEVDLALNLPPYSANPSHRDLFVEVDHMSGMSAPSASFDKVKQSFAAAPGSNPDGNPGIALTVIVDESVPLSETIQYRQYTPNPMPCVGSAYFENLRDGYFGFAAERASPATIQAKRLSVRYAIMAKGQRAENNCSSDGSSGIASGFPAPDFIVTLGDWEPSRLEEVSGGGCGGLDSVACGKREAYAGTFMHELGHTLGLYHGGSDHVNCKPNYASVMSYTLQFKDYAPNRPLDYSKSLLGELNEASLNELEGVGGLAGDYVVWGITRPSGVRDSRATPANGPIDWDNVGGATAPSTSADINYFPEIGGCNTPGLESSLKGHNDWDNIVFNFRDSLAFNSAQGFGSADHVPDEITSEEVRVAALTLDPDGDGVPLSSDNCPAVSNPDQADTDNNGVGNACSAPTAGTVLVSGRVTNSAGRGIKGVIVEIIDGSGHTRRSISSSFGYYAFENVQVGDVFVLSVRSKRFRFDPSTRLISVFDDLANVDFVTASD